MGRAARCVECVNAIRRAKRAENPDAVRIANRERMRRHRAKSPDLPKSREEARRWERANPEKRRAHWRVKDAIKRGHLVKGPCEVCGSERVHAHHDDYSKPLEVRWLCPTHHGEAHRLPKGTPLGRK